MRSLRNRALLLALLVVALVVAVGCGGGGSSAGGAAGASASGSGGASGPTSPARFATTASSAEGESVESEVRTEDPVSEGAAAVSIEPRGASPMEDNDEVQSTGAKPVRPCKLVTAKEAATILGKGTTAAERPQGPTCVYTNAGRTVTLAVEVNSVKRLRHAARKATKVPVGNRVGWCIKYQSAAVVIGIGGGRVLRADGACQAGVRFVAEALHRI